MLAGHENVSTGEILLGNQLVNSLPPAERGTAMMFQDYALFPHMNCLDNIAFSLKVRGINKPERYAKANKLLDLVQMKEYGLRKPAQLSGGQQHSDQMLPSYNGYNAVTHVDKNIRHSNLGC